MAEKKETATKVKAEKKEKKVAKKEETKAKKVVKADTTKKDIAKATSDDFKVILHPIITEKSMAIMQNQNQATFMVDDRANKTQVKLAFERLFKVKATHVSIVTVRAKSTTRGGRYQGKFNGYKKAIITIHQGQAIDLFKE